MSLEDTITSLTRSTNLLSQQIYQLTRAINNQGTYHGATAMEQNFFPPPIEGPSGPTAVVDDRGVTVESAQRRKGRPPGAKNKKNGTTELVRGVTGVVYADVERGSTTGGSPVLRPEIKPEPEPETNAATKPAAPATHEAVREQARHLVSAGGTDKLKAWLKDEFEVETITMLPAERLEEALASIRKLV